MTEQPEAMKLLQKHFDIALETPDGIKKLRELILTLAMQGKLVKQDPKDQPASELLKEIEAEKKRLVKEGKIRKQEPLPPIKPDEIPYAIPQGWEWVRLNEIVEYNGRPNATPDQISPDTWVLDLEDIEKDTSIILKRTVYAERQSKSNKSTFCIGDVLYGKLRPYLNKVIVADRDGVCTTEIVPIVPFSGIDSIFLKTLLKRPSFIAHVNELSYGVKMPRLGTADAVKSIHPLPPLAEQKRIVARIDQLMALCDKLEAERNARDQKRLDVHAAAISRLLAASEQSDFDKSWQFMVKHFSELYAVSENVAELKKAILQLAVMGKLVPQNQKDQPASELLKEIEAEKQRLVKEGKIRKQEPLPPIKPAEIPYTLPNGWMWVSITEICEKVTDGFHNTPKKLSNGKIYISATHIREQGIKWAECLYVSEKDHDELFKKTYPRKGEILVTNRGAGCGTPAIIDIEEEFSFQNAAILGFNQEKIYNRYMFYHLLINREQIMATFVSGGMQPMLSNVTLRTIPFPLPPLAEQKRIVARIDQLMALCDTLQQQLVTATGKQTAILDAVLSKV